MHDKFRVQQIDHVEFLVPDRREAAKWYDEMLGLVIVKEREFWADDPRGPLMISSDGGNTNLALFQGEARAGPGVVAFRVDAQGFADFLSRLGYAALFDHDGKRVSSKDVVDHDGAYSIYFCDPYGHRLEVTTYD